MALEDESQKELLKKIKRRKKYNAYRICIDGQWFDSRTEGARWVQLKQLEQAGYITGLEVHPAYKFKSGIVYKPDFRYFQGPQIVEDVKSRPTLKAAAYRMKKKLMRHEFGVEIKEVKMIQKVVDAILSRLIVVDEHLGVYRFLEGSK